MFVNITEKPPWGSVIKAITYYLLLITVHQPNSTETKTSLISIFLTL